MTTIPAITLLTRYTSPASRVHPGRVIKRRREEVEIIMAGSGSFLVDGTYREVGPGGMLWYFEGEPIHVTSPASHPYTCLVVSLRVARERSAHRRPQRLTQWRNTDEAIAFAREALDRYHPNMPALDLFTAYLYSRVEWEAAEHRRIAATASRRSPRALEQAVEWIRNHYLENFSVADLSAAAGVSEPRLYSLFRERFGESPMQRVIRFRVQHARDLLTTTNLSVNEIGFAAGFRDAVHFGRLFKSRTGYAPGAYRKLFGLRL